MRQKILNLLKVIKPRDVWDLFVILLTCPIGLILRLFKKNIWIVSEMEHTARDNGYWFFKYLRENDPDRPVYYPIRFDSPDYEKVAALGNVIRHGSLRHHIYTWAAQADISARTGRGLPTRMMSRLLQSRGLFPCKTVFLQHGVMMNAPEFLDKRLNKIDLFITTTEAEADGIAKDLHYDRNQLCVTGLCRYDQLNSFTVNKKQILLMPTWRNWLYSDYGKVTEEALEKVRNSDYVKTYCDLLADKRLHAFLEENDLHILFFPHNQMQPYLKAFTADNSRIRIASTADSDVQTALKESAFLITDYSSILFDFAYMKKPMCLYQFDYEDFRKGHYPESYFSYENDAFGKVVRTKDELLDCLFTSYRNDFRMDRLYEDRVDRTFRFRDNNNCLRNLQAIENLLNNK